MDNIDTEHDQDVTKDNMLHGFYICWEKGKTYARRLFWLKIICLSLCCPKVAESYFLKNNMLPSFSICWKKAKHMLGDYSSKILLLFCAKVASVVER